MGRQHQSVSSGSISVIEAEHFRPHRFTSNGPTTPVVRVAARALSRMYLFVDYGEDEISWLGTCRRKSEREFLIEEVFLFPQQVNKTSTIISAESLAEFANDLLLKKNGISKLNRLFLWGHSHGNLPVSPSSADNRQMEYFSQSGATYFIRAIANRHGTIRFDVYLYDTKKTFLDVPWMVDYRIDGTLRRNVTEEIGNKVQRR